MYSKRLHWDAKPNRLTALLAEKRRTGAKVFDLTESNPTHAGLHYPSDVLNAFADSRILRYDPASAGSIEAREAVSAYYAARGREISPDRILLTASTSEAYAYLFKLLTDPGDAVAAPRPSYPLFDYLAAMESIAVRPYPLVYGGEWSIDVARVPSGVKAILLVNPNNPTGSYLKSGELDSLLTLGAPIISDEVFSDYAFGPDSHRVESLAGFDEALSFSMSGLSKAAGLPQMKLGWIVVNGPEARRREAFEKLEWIADTYLSVSTPVQCAAARLLRAGEEVQAGICARTALNLAKARTVFAGSAAGLLNVEGGWYAVAQVPRTRSEEEWALELLDRENVLTQPGFFYDFESEAYLVLSLLTPPEDFETGARRLRDLVERGSA
jgi:aspartate/methionine/tyrosine aminotransferase